jgi:hypothetical protein
MDTKLLTYAELAQALGITAASAKRLAIRRGWPKQPGNDGRARVAVPVERLLRPNPIGDDDASDDPDDGTSDSTGEAASDDTSESAGGLTSVVNVLTQHIERLAKEIENLKVERDAAQARATALAADAATATALRGTVDALKAALESEKGRLAEVRQDRDRLRVLSALAPASIACAHGRAATSRHAASKMASTVAVLRRWSSLWRSAGTCW